MIARFAVWLGKILLGKSAALVGGLAAGAVLVILGLGGSLYARHWFAEREAERLTEARDEALVDLGRCQEVNAGNAREIERINEQAAANQAAAETERLRAERAAAVAVAELEDADARHERELAALRDALAGDECGDRLLPAPADCLWRSESPGDCPR